MAVALTDQEQIALTMLSANPGFAAFCKLAEGVVTEARDEILQIPPHKNDEILAAAHEARAMAKFYTRLRKQMDSHLAEHFDKVKSLAVQEEIAKLDPNDQ